ncbi:hypothetical protein WOLCODRAFT_166399, partial [Wolfiporia cocos MD-104 SS10]
VPIPVRRAVAGAVRAGGHASAAVPARDAAHALGGFTSARAPAPTPPIPALALKPTDQPAGVGRRSCAAAASAARACGLAHAAAAPARGEHVCTAGAAGIPVVDADACANAAATSVRDDVHVAD